MDFVVVGLGVGALGVLLGLIMRGWLAGRSERAAQRASTPAVAAFERATAAECRGAGQAFIAAGGAVLLATIGGLAGALDDGTGAFLVATTASVAALGILVWGYLYRSRNPLPPRPRRQPLAVAPAGDPAGSDMPGASSPLAVETAPDPQLPDTLVAETDGTADVPADADEPAATSALDSPGAGVGEADRESRGSDEAPDPEDAAANGRGAHDPIVEEAPATVAPGVAERAGEGPMSGRSESDDG